ncbi:macro domain-containing protein [Laspinema sp. D1]|uniref:Macro domain-containing protein n=1 Tax=Laspinema palackyanum D2a TaxID=2953684 RepID=A0ABT2MZ14_9CYAN|nr:macro domain-containing protein [Laspinema sp. D2a]
MDIQLIPLRAAVCSERSTTLDVLVRITPPAPEKPMERPQLNLGLVIDRSGSMSGPNIEYAKQAASYAVEQLLPSDRVSITIYDDEVETLVPSTLANHKSHLLQQIKGIQVRNSTALHAGWMQGGNQVSQHLNSEHLNRVILLSDGLANVGETNPDVIASDVNNLTKRGVSTTTMGIGNHYNEDLLEAMARSGDGNYYYIQSPEQLPSIFQQELLGLMATVGINVTLGIEPQAGVELVEVLNQLEVNQKGRFRLPNLVIGNPVDVVLRLKVPALTEEVDLCYFRLTWNTPEQPTEQKIRVSLRLPVVNAAQLEEFPFNSEVRQQAILMMTARAKKEAVKLVDGGNYDGAILVLQQTKQQLLNNPDLPMSAPEAEALDDLEVQLKQREYSTYRKMSTQQSYRRGSRRSSGHVSLLYAYRKGPVLGNITEDLGVDAIVNSCDRYLSNFGAISSAIHQAAGPELLAECRRLGGCEEGDAKITPGYNLPTPWVIHTVCPPWRGGSHGEEDLLAKCYRRCLELALHQSLRSIAFPAIGTGAMRFPVELAAKIAYAETSRFLINSSAIGAIVFVCFDADTHRCFQKEFVNYSGL